GFNSSSQFVAVHIRDVVSDTITETLYKTVNGIDPLLIPMNQFCLDISAYSGDTIRIDFEFQVQDNCMDIAFDNFRITKSGTLPDQAVLAASQTTSCTPGDDITLYVESGDLNASGVWIWYQDTCGLDSIGIGTIITVAPLENTSYFARAGGGCNSEYGACAEITIYMDTIAPVPNRATLPDIQEFCKAYEIAPPSATDNCLGEILATTTDTTSFGVPGNYSILWTFEDRNGNAAEQSQNVLIGFDTTTTQNVNILMANQAGDTYQWLDCNNGNAVIIGETGQSFIPSLNGSYAVEVSENGCIDTSLCKIVTNVSVTENNYGDKLIYYPNPTSDKLNINLGTNLHANGIIMKNVFGQVVLSKRINPTNLINLELNISDGVYFIYVFFEQGDTKVFKIIKKK
ncbi:MAG: T9SS type A sorting domain-containing protein, partial [Cyclobacteriaceae bacterium]|nr:T9SS type A sorting domain-containing protein [Cyclobacteriaceae bacterium]